MGSFLAAADPKMADFVGQEQEPEWLADITGEGKLFFVSTAFVTVHGNKCYAVINTQCVKTGDFGDLEKGDRDRFHINPIKAQIFCSILLHFLPISC